MLRFFSSPLSGLSGLLFVLLLTTCSGCAGIDREGDRHPPFPLPEFATPSPLQLTPPEEDPIRDSYAAFALFAVHSAHGRYDEARRHLEQAIEHNPDDVFLLQRMALLLKQQKQNEEALRYARKCVELDPDRVDHHLLVAEIARLLGQEGEAVRSYEQALAIDPEHNRARLVLTTLLIKMERHDEALSQLNRIIEQDPNLVIAHYYRGRVFLEKGDPERSEESYLEALRLNERMEPALFDLGSLYQMRGRFDKAVEIYERLIDYYPVNMIVRERLIDLYYKLDREDEAERQMEAIKGRSEPGERVRQSLGLIYLRHGKLDESINELDMIVQAWPDDDKSRYYLASAYEERGDLDLALEQFRELKKGSKYHSNAQMHIAYILDAQQKTAEAEAVLREALLGEDGQKPDLYLMLASILEGQDRYEEAEAVLLESLENEPANAELVFRLGVVLDKKGERERSLEQMRRVLEIEPDHADALNYIGYTYAEQGIRLDEALDLIQQAMKIKPDSGYITDSLGWVYFQRGEYEKALELLVKASALQPEDPTITEHLGDAYAKNGRYEKAIEAYLKAIQLDHDDPEALKKKIDEVEALLDGKKESD